MKEKVTEIFCIVDDFCNTVDENFAEKLLPSGKNQPGRQRLRIQRFLP